MKTILCYGDSNTWGYDPAQNKRLGYKQRWPGVLQNELGKEYLVIEEGLSGRTTVWDDPIEGYKNGKKYLIPCLETHKPIDLVLIMLGTNDLKHRFSLTAFDIAQGAGVLVDIVQRSKTGPEYQAPQVLLLAPPPLVKLTVLAEMFKDSEEKSKLLGKHYKKVAADLGCYFIDTAETITSSPIDGIHLEQSEHLKLGKKVADSIKNIFKK